MFLVLIIFPMRYYCLFQNSLNFFKLYGLKKKIFYLADA